MGLNHQSSLGQASGVNGFTTSAGWVSVLTTSVELPATSSLQTQVGIDARYALLAATNGQMSLTANAPVGTFITIGMCYTVGSTNAGCDPVINGGSFPWTQQLTTTVLNQVTPINWSFTEIAKGGTLTPTASVKNVYVNVYAQASSSVAWQVTASPAAQLNVLLVQLN